MSLQDTVSSTGKQTKTKTNFVRSSTLKKVLKSNNFSVKEPHTRKRIVRFGTQDASMVLVLGPEEEFFDAEIDVLNEYREQGGLCDFFGAWWGDHERSSLSTHITFDPAAYLSNAKINVPLQTNKSPADVRNLVSIKYSTHASVSNLSKSSKALPSYFLGAGTLKKGTDSKATATVRSMEKTFDDRNQNFKLTKIQRSRADLGYRTCSSAPVEEKESRVLVMADTTWLSDVVLVQSKGNQLLLNDALMWLLNDSSSAGEISDEQDVEVFHTKEGQGFSLAIIFLLPIGIFILGSVYVRNRQRKGES